MLSPSQSSCIDDSLEQLERALKLWAGGKNPLTKVPANGSSKRAGPEPFTEAAWGLRARNWVKTAARLSDGDWVQIMSGVASRVQGCTPGGSDESDAIDGLDEGAGVATLDPRTCIEL